MHTQGTRTELRGDPWQANGGQAAKTAGILAALPRLAQATVAAVGVTGPAELPRLAQATVAAVGVTGPAALPRLAQATVVRSGLPGAVEVL